MIELSQSQIGAPYFRAAQACEKIEWYFQYYNYYDANWKATTVEPNETRLVDPTGVPYRVPVKPEAWASVSLAYNINKLKNEGYKGRVKISVGRDGVITLTKTILPWGKKFSELANLNFDQAEDYAVGLVRK